MSRIGFRLWVALGFVALLGALVFLLVLPRHRTPAVRVVWTFEPPERGAIVSSPLVAGDRVYVAAIQDLGPSSSGAVYALDRATGKVKWKFDAAGTMLPTYSSPCLDSGRLYLGEGMHGDHVCNFYCLDAATGKGRWRATASDHIESSPCVSGGKVFFAAGDDGVFALDAARGTLAWHVHPPGHIDCSPVVDGPRLYVGSGLTNTQKTTALYCLDPTDGRELWHVATDLPVWGSPGVAGDLLFVPLGNGRLLESVEPPGRPAGAMLCLDAATGRERWRYPVGDGILVGPTLDGDRVYFGARDGSCHCLDRDGRSCWSADLGSPVVTRPALLDHRLYVVPLRGPVVCLDAATGRRLWAYDLAATSRTTPQLVSSPAVLDAREAGRGRRDIFFGAELKNPVRNAAVLYCLRD
jgi:outer membrane protein assembly factor BamB